MRDNPGAFAVLRETCNEFCFQIARDHLREAYLQRYGIAADWRIIDLARDPFPDWIDPMRQRAPVHDLRLCDWRQDYTLRPGDAA